MFFLLLLVIAAFGGLLLAVESGSINLEMLSGWPIAVAVIGVLVILYLATLHGGDGERRFRRVLIVIIAITILGVRRANPALQPAGTYCKLFVILKFRRRAGCAGTQCTRIGAHPSWCRRSFRRKFRGERRGHGDAD